MNNIVENAQAQIDPSVLLQLLSAIQPPQPIAGGVGGPQRAPNPVAPPPTAAPVRPQAPTAGPVTPPNFMEVGGRRFEYPAVRKTTAPIKKPTTAKKKSMTGEEKLFKFNAYIDAKAKNPHHAQRGRAQAALILAKEGVDQNLLTKWIATGSEMNLPKHQPSGYADTEGRQSRMAAKKKKLEIMLKPDKDGNLSDDQFQAVKQDLIDAGMEEKDITTGKGAAFWTFGMGEKGGRWRLTPKAKAKYTEMIMQEGSSGGGRTTTTPPSPTAPQGSFSEGEMMKMMIHIPK